MKRTLYLLLLVLMVASLAGTAEARTRKKQPPQKPATVDMDNGGDRDGDKDRPKRGPNVKKERKSSDDETPIVEKPAPIPFGKPIEMQLKRAASKRFDLRALPARRPEERERPELEPPFHTPVQIDSSNIELPEPSIPGAPPLPYPPAPSPNIVFEGLDREFWGAGSPPDTTGDVGPTYYIQAVNTSVGVYDKAGNQQAAFTFDTLMSQGAFGNLCDTENFGDPVVLYDSFEDRWVLTDFAFLTDGGGNPVTPAFQCFAVSMTNNPLTGGWNFYSIQINDFLNDYEKLAIWPDGIYMSANMFGFGAGGTFQGARVWAFNKMQMYAGSPTVQVVSFNATGGDFTLLPSNARLQTGTPPPGRPNLFISSWLFTNALTVYKFHVDWNSVSLSTFTGPDTPIAATSWPNAAVANAPQPGTANLLDVLQIRAMIQNQYTNFGGTESLWVPHTVRRANTTGFAAPRWYQVDVTGGNVNPAIPQAATWDPDAANTNHRFMPSLALDRGGNLALGYSISNATTRFPSIAYAGRLAGDPVNTFSQTETFMFTGTASQTTSTRWGDYSTMTLDPDGCTFWYTNEYANPADQTAAKRWKTKIGSFAYPSCTPVGAGGTVTGTVTETPGGTPISGATITFGARTTTTNGSGVYSFLNIPAGTYPSISATKPGYSTASASSIVVTDGGTTIQDFALSLAPASACLTDTTQADFQTGVLSNVDVLTAPGDVTLVNIAVDQQNTAGTTTGTGFGTPNWTGQTFIPSVTGQLLRVESTIFCNGCGATPPNLTLSVRATAAGLPTGADLASVTIPGSNYASGASVTFMATFGAPATLTAGTQYALVMRPVSVPAGSGYFWIRSSPSTYASGSRVLSADSGGTWSTDTTRDYNFKAVMAGPYNPPSGNLVSNNKDSNPLGGLTPIWSTLSWNGTTPANTTLQFQVAGSNNPGGPFNFIGPDGTAGTFFTTSPGTLDVIYNLRYARYKAYLATSNNVVTPTLNDVTICVNNVDCSAPITITPTQTPVCENSTGNTASGPAGATSYSWSITNGTITSATNIQSITYTAGASGNVGLTLNIVEAGGCHKSANLNVPINVVAAPTITPTPAQVCANSTGNSADGPAGFTTYSWSIVNGTITSATNIQTITYTAGASGTVDLTLSVTDSAGCPSPSTTVNVTINANPSTPTITPTPATVCANSTGNSADGPAGATTYAWSIVNGTITSATNIQTITYTAGASGTVDLTLVVTNAAGCSATNTVNVTINANPTATITPNPAQVCASSTGNTADGPAGATTYAWSIVNGTITSAANIQTITYTAGASGTVDLTLTVTNAAGCSDTNTVNVTINANPTATITPTPAQVCASSAGNTADGPAGMTTYLWSIVNGTITSAPNIQTITYTAGASGTVDLTLTVTNAAGCSDTTTVNVTINANPATPTITPTPAQVCANSAGNTAAGPAGATTYAWSIVNGTITSATNGQNITYTAGASGTVDLTLVVTNAAGCSATNTVNVTINANPTAPTITPTPAQVCANSAGNTAAGPAGATTYAWSIVNGTITSATNGQNITYTAGASGTVDLTLVVTNAAGCSATNTVNVTVNPLPNATITAPGSVQASSTGNAASVANAGVGATYNWTIGNGTITAGAGTPNITFTAGSVGILTLNVTVTTGAGCSDSGSANVNVTAIPNPTVTNVSPNSGTYYGGTAVTITGTLFQSGASVTFGGSAATSVVVVNATTITAVTPAHAVGAVNVTVTNPDTTSGTLTNGYTYIQQFDPNNDGMIDPSDIFYLVHYLFAGGPAPIGPAGLLSGDANGDSVVDPADIFYVVNYLFLSGPAPAVTRGQISTEAGGRLAGSVTLGTPVVREGRTFIPVIVGTGADSIQPQALSLKLRLSGDASIVAIRRAGAAVAAQPAFETTRATADGAAYLVAFDGRANVLAAAGRSAVVAEIEVTRGTAQVRIDVDPALTMLSRGGVNQATVAKGTLQVRGVTIAPSFERRPDARERN